MTRSRYRTATLFALTLLFSHWSTANDALVLYGVVEFGSAGRPVASAGDLNNDGLNDIVTCASAGSQCYVLYGTAEPFEETLTLDQLYPGNNDGSLGFLLLPRENDDAFGRRAEPLGDVNGDGIDDLLISASFADFDGVEAGEAYVIYGRNGNFPPAFSMRSLLPPIGDGSAGVVIRGIDTLDRMSTDAAGPGDINGDGFNDILLGASQADVDGVDTTGEAYVVFGSANLPAVINLSDLLAANGGDGSAGFVLEGTNRNDNAGSNVHAIGDITGDGLADFAVVAPFFDPPGFDSGGAVYVVYGRASGYPAQFPLGSLAPAGGGDGSEGFFVPGNDDTRTIGNAMLGADINGDGRTDLVIGNGSGNVDAGEGYVLYGTADGTYPTEFDVDSLLVSGGGDGSVGVVIQGIASGDSATGSLANLGDVNGDDIDDLLIGAAGRDLVGSASIGSALLLYGSGNFPAEVPLADLLPVNGGDGSAGTLFEGIDALDVAGSAVASAGDFNADGLTDLLIGADDADALGVSNAGEVYLIYGRADGFPARFALGTLLPFRIVTQGQCPGLSVLAVEGASPLRQVSVYSSRTVGDAVVPDGPCAGTPTSLGAPQLRQMGNAAANGKVTFEGQVGPGSCGAFAQAVDLETCEISSLARFPLN